MQPVAITQSGNPNSDQENFRVKKPAWGIWIGLISLAFGAIIVCLTLSHNGWDALGFAKIGTFWAEKVPYPLGTNGYDGQFYYQIARYGVNATPFLDTPAYRYLRILYPLIARLISFGIPFLIPWALIIINLFSVAVGAGVISVILGQLRVSPLYGLVYTLWIGNIISQALDLSEPLCLALALLAILFYRRGNRIAAVILLVFSTLTRETGLVFAGGLAFYELIDQRDIKNAFQVIAPPLLAWGFWASLVSRLTGASPFQNVNSSIELPFMGFMALFHEPPNVIPIALLVVIPTILLLTASMWTAIKTQRFHMSTCVCLAACGLISVMPHATWREPIAVLRVSTPLIIGGLIFLADEHPRWAPIAAGFWSPMIVLAFYILPTI